MRTGTSEASPPGRADGTATRFDTHVTRTPDAPRSPALPRCSWAATDDLLARYHDEEWGRLPETEAAAFELLTLEVFQGGLAWRTVLARRGGFRVAFDGFDAERLAAFGPADLERLCADPRIIRHARRIAATIENAHRLREARAVWGRGPEDRSAFVRRLRAARTEGRADDLATELQDRFRAVGPSVARSFLVAAGVVPAPHESGCWRASRG